MDAADELEIEETAEAFTEAPEELLDCEGVTILDIKFNQCRCVTGRNGAGFVTFCAEPVARAGESWCADHRARFYLPGSARVSRKSK